MALFRSSKRNARVHDEENQLILSKDSPWQLQEAYKALRTNVLFSLPGNTSKVIGVTSALRHDGKSCNAVNLAISFGQLGKKTCVIDCDLRMPTVASKLEVSKRPGLSDYLSGQALIGDVLINASKHKIHVIPAGNIPPDPTVLLQSAQMKKLIHALRSVYDYIIIDLPPATVVADAAIISEMVDGYIVVVRHNVTDYSAVNEMLAQLQLTGEKIIGFIYNGAEAGGSRYRKDKYYRYSYKRD